MRGRWRLQQGSWSAAATSTALWVRRWRPDPRGCGGSAVRIALGETPNSQCGGRSHPQVRARTPSGALRATDCTDATSSRISLLLSHFATRAALLAEREGHHPDVRVGWGYLEVELTTHAAGGLTRNDFIMAAKIDQAVRHPYGQQIFAAD